MADTGGNVVRVLPGENHGQRADRGNQFGVSADFVQSPFFGRGEYIGGIFNKMVRGMFSIPFSTMGMSANPSKRLNFFVNFSFLPTSVRGHPAEGPLQPGGGTPDRSPRSSRGR